MSTKNAFILKDISSIHLCEKAVIIKNSGGWKDTLNFDSEDIAEQNFNVLMNVLNKARIVSVEVNSDL
jgi:hypothetical protein